MPLMVTTHGYKVNWCRAFTIGKWRNGFWKKTPCLKNCSLEKMQKKYIKKWDMFTQNFTSFCDFFFLVFISQFRSVISMFRTHFFIFKNKTSFLLIFIFLGKLLPSYLKPLSQQKLYEQPSGYRGAKWQNIDRI